jgi:hypothetical protein
MGHWFNHSQFFWMWIEQRNFIRKTSEIVTKFWQRFQWRFCNSKLLCFTINLRYLLGFGIPSRWHHP